MVDRKPRIDPRSAQGSNDALTAAIRKAEQAVLKGGGLEEKEDALELDLPGTSKGPALPPQKPRADAAHVPSQQTRTTATKPAPKKSAAAPALATPQATEPVNRIFGEVVLDEGDDSVPALGETSSGEANVNPSPVGQQQPASIGSKPQVASTGSKPQVAIPKQTPATTAPKPSGRMINLQTGEAAGEVPQPAPRPVPARVVSISMDSDSEEQAKVPRSAQRPQPKADIPKRSYAREIKIGAIILAALLVIGGAIFGIVKWRESVQKQQDEETARLNQGSLDSLKDQALKKEQRMP